MKKSGACRKKAASAFSPIGALLAHVRAEVLVLLLLAAAFVVAGMVKSALDPGGKAAPRGIRQVRLTAETVGEWARGAAVLGASREAGKQGFGGESLALFVEWGRNNFEALEDSVRPVDADRFLGLTASIERARRNMKKQVEYEMMAAEEQSAGERFRAAGIIPAFAPPPAMEKWEEEDLRAYEASFDEIETALLRFMPRIGLPVPAWDVRETSASRDEADGTQGISRP